MPRKSKASDTSVKDLIQDFKDLKGEIKELIGSGIKSVAIAIKEEIGSNLKSARKVCERPRPKSTLEFQQYLRKYTYFNLPYGYVPNSNNFRIFYDALQLYRNTFLRVYEIMASDNEYNIPECNNEEGGIVRIFTEKIPFNYGQNVIYSFSKKKFDNIYEFLKNFYKVVEAHYAGYEKSRLCDQRHQGKRSRSDEVSPRPLADEANNRPKISSTMQKPSLKEAHPIARIGKTNDEAVQKIVDSDKPLVNSSEPESAKIQMRCGESLEAADLKAIPEMSEEPQTSASSQTGCFQMIFQGSCSFRSSCNNPHDPNAVKKSHEQLTEPLANSACESSTLLTQPPSTARIQPEPMAKMGVEPNSSEVFSSPSEAPTACPISVAVEAQANASTPLLCVLTKALHCKEKPYEDYVSCHLPLAEHLVASHFQTKTDWITLLHGKGQCGFATSDWEYIYCSPLLELSWKKDMPTRTWRMKPRARRDRLIKLFKKRLKPPVQP